MINKEYMVNTSFGLLVGFKKLEIPLFKIDCLIIFFTPLR